MAPHNRPPDRWMDYSPMGEKISGTRFICMKVPLKPHLSRNIEEEDQFSCDTAVQMAMSKGHNLGLVIDLSFTKKYYNPEDFESKNIKYKKIFMPGRVIPEKSIIDEFKETVLNFETENKDNNNLIAVHCTHGLNRTGFMICRHLIDEKKFDPKDAIDRFETARGHKIERDIYRNNLLGVKTAESNYISPRNRSSSKRSPLSGAGDSRREFWTDPFCNWERTPNRQGPYWNGPFYHNHPQNFKHNDPPFQSDYGCHGNFVPPQQAFPSQYYYGDHNQPYHNNRHGNYNCFPHPEQDWGYQHANRRYYPYARSMHEQNRWSESRTNQKR